MKKVLVISDSFKGSLSSLEIVDIANELNDDFKNINIHALPVADGGEGSVDCFISALNATKKEIIVNDAYLIPTLTYYARKDDIAFIELASCCGLPKVSANPNPSLTSTYGVGEQIKDAILNGAKKIIIAIGGSSTNDAGVGAMCALGAKFINKKGESFIPVGGTLNNIKDIDLTELNSLTKDISFIAMCDVKNPLYGKNGAAYIYAPQKGADEKMVKILDDNLKYLSDLLIDKYNIDISSLEGSGAAGGFGGGCKAFLNANLKSGIETVLDLLNFNDLLKEYDYVITGEGRLDSQSLNGKVVSGILNRVKQDNKQMIILAGTISKDSEDYLNDDNIKAIFSINREAKSYKESKNESRINYKLSLKNILSLLN